jgi:hypothetical protein
MKLRFVIRNNEKILQQEYFRDEGKSLIQEWKDVPVVELKKPREMFIIEFETGYQSTDCRKYAEQIMLANPTSRLVVYKEVLQGEK